MASSTDIKVIFLNYNGQFGGNLADTRYSLQFSHRPLLSFYLQVYHPSSLLNPAQPPLRAALRDSRTVLTSQASLSTKRVLSVSKFPSSPHSESCKGKGQSQMARKGQHETFDVKKGLCLTYSSVTDQLYDLGNVIYLLCFQVPCLLNGIMMPSSQHTMGVK